MLVIYKLDLEDGEKGVREPVRAERGEAHGGK